MAHSRGPITGAAATWVHPERSFSKARKGSWTPRAAPKRLGNQNPGVSGSAGSMLRVPLNTHPCPHPCAPSCFTPTSKSETPAPRQSHAAGRQLYGPQGHHPSRNYSCWSPCRDKVAGFPRVPVLPYIYQYFLFLINICQQRSI